MHTAQSYLVGNILAGQFGIAQVVVHHLDDALQQALVG